MGCREKKRNVSKLHIDDIALDGEQFVFENNQCYKTVNRPRDAN